MSLLFPWKNTNIWVQAQTEATNRRVQIAALPYLEAVSALILYAFQLLCQPSQVCGHKKTRVGLPGFPCPLRSALVMLTHMLCRAMCVTLGNFSIRCFIFCFPWHQPVPLQWRLHPSPFLGPHSMCRIGWTCCSGGGTEPTHKEDVLGMSARKFSLRSCPGRLSPCFPITIIQG